jgi:hypothetical protein
MVATSAMAAEVKSVEGRRFCVHAENLIQPDVWLKQATRHLPEMGFAFRILPEQLPASVIGRKDAQGHDMPTTGTIESLSSGRAIDHYPADHYWRRMARMPNAIVAVDEKLQYLSVFENAKKEFWVVWQAPVGAPLTVASIDDRASVVASCHRTSLRALPQRRIDETASCARNIRADAFRISYDFDPANLPGVQQLDSAVSRAVLSWQCKE